MPGLRHLPLCVVLGAALVAQAPDQWLAISATSAATDGGVYLHPGRGSVVSTPVTGLPPELIGLGDGVQRGASAIAFETGTGALIVGEHGPTGTAIDLHRVQVSGTAGTVLGKAPLGTVAAATGGVEDLAALPDGRIVFCVRGLANAAPLHGARLGVFTPGTGAIAPIATSAPPGDVHCVAADPTGTTLYFHVRDAVGSQGGLYRAPVTGGAATQLRRVALLRSLTTDVRGHLFGVGNSYHLEMSPTDGALLSSHIYNLQTRGVAIRPLSQEVLVVAAQGYPLNGLFVGSTQLTVSVPDGSNGLAVVESHHVYGPRTDGAAAYDWVRTATTPRPGFVTDVRVDGTGPAAAAGLLFAALRPGASTLAGVEVLLDTNATATLGLIAPGAPLPLAIPGGVSPGVQLFLQAAFPDGGAPAGLAATRGLQLTLRP